MTNRYNLHTYEADGVSILESDLASLRDRAAKLRIMRRIQRMELGNFGDHKSVGGGLWEMRIDYGPGYRVYYAIDGIRIVLLFCAGDKNTQDADIKRARMYKRDYDTRK